MWKRGGGTSPYVDLEYRLALGPKELTDDRLGRLLEVLGADAARSAAYQQQQSQHLIRAYALPTAVVRYDTTTFNVHHTPTAETAAAGVLAFGYSKDHRPDLLQFKQGWRTLDQVEAVVAEYQRWRDVLVAGLNAIPGVQC